MADEWEKGGPFGSLRKRVAWEVKEHLRTNAAIKSARAPLRMRALQTMLSERGLFEFFTLYGLFLVLLVAAEISVAQCCAYLVPSWTNAPGIALLLKDATSYFLGAQVTMIGLLFPIAVGLVTLIVQREDASSTVSDVQIYYHQTLAYQVGASGIALSIVLAIQLLWPVQFVAHRFGIGTSAQLFKIILTASHLAWLILNFVALWHFLATSLSFIRPTERDLMRRRFAAQVSIPQDISALLANWLYIGARKYLLRRTGESADDDAPRILLGSDIGESGTIEVTAPRSAGKILCDVWMKPLGWTIRRWWKRCLKNTPGGFPHGACPTLIFVPALDKPLSEGAAICRRNRGVPLSRVERRVIQMCFRFKRAKT